MNTQQRFLTIFLALQVALSATISLQTSFSAALPLLAISLWITGLTLNQTTTPQRKNLLRRSTLALAATASLGLLALFALRFPQHVPDLSANSAFPIASLAALSFAAYLLRIHRQVDAQSESPASALASHCLNLLLATNLLLLGVALFQSYTKLPVERWIGAVLSLVSIIWILETAARWIARFYQPPRLWKKAPPLGSSVVLRPLSPKNQTATTETQELKKQALQIADMWLLPQIAKASPLLAFTAIALFWTSTSFHQVPLGQSGLRRTFGKLSPERLEPGLHLSLPWPLAKVETNPTERIANLDLGHDSDPLLPVLWDKKHYEGEMNLLVGNGGELLTVAVPIFYRIKDPYLFQTSTLDAEQTIKLAGYQTLTRATLGQSAFDIMTADREALRSTIKAKLQADLDQRRSGIEVTSVLLKDIHPPVSVASSYQEVISAEEDKEAYIHTAHDYAAQSLPRSQSQNVRLTTEADTAREERLQIAYGEAKAFTDLIAPYRQSPHLFRTRSYYAAFDQALGGVKKLISDSRIDEPTTTYVDLRKTLNPDLANTTTSTPQSLIPSGKGHQSDFDKEMDGYLFIGEAAAPQTYPSAEIE